MLHKRQIPQIGILKAIGSTRRQITSMYLSAIFVYGFLSLVIAVPIGAYAGNALALMTNLLAADPDTLDRFFHSARSHYRRPRFGRVDVPESRDLRGSRARSCRSRRA